MSSRRAGRGLAAVVLMFLAGACAETEFVLDSTKAVTRSSPPGGYKVGEPYQIQGVWYYPAVDYEYNETGIASWYGEAFHGKATANGELYDMNELTAAHRTLPLPSVVRVTNLENGRSMTLRVNDRGPFAHGRIIDVSRRAAQLLGFEQQGTARVRVEILADESRMLAGQAGGTTQLAAGETAPEAAPRIAVTAEPLPATGAAAAPATGGTAAAPSTSPAAVQQLAAVGAVAPDGRVTQLPVTATSIYVQAGAFSDIYNANRLQARLRQFGQVLVAPVVVDGQQFYRVRVGPLGSVEDADRMLSQVVAAGHPEARLVVD